MIVAIAVEVPKVILRSINYLGVVVTELILPQWVAVAWEMQKVVIVAYFQEYSLKLTPEENLHTTNSHDKIITTISLK